jgi:hypothetical protein
MLLSVDAQSIFRSSTIEKFRVHPTLNPHVGLLRLFPNITVHVVSGYVFSMLLTCNQNTLCPQLIKMNLVCITRASEHFHGLSNNVVICILNMQVWNMWIWSYSGFWLSTNQLRPYHSKVQLIFVKHVVCTEWKSRPSGHFVYMQWFLCSNC